MSSIPGQIKLHSCPFCGFVGALILHGYLRGYVQKFIGKRGIRIICNNRRKSRKGCGKTFSYLFSFLLKSRSYTVKHLWCAIEKISSMMSIKYAFFSSGFTCSLKTIYRLWKRFKSRQSVIRSTLLSYSPVPIPTINTPYAIIQTLSHLKRIFINRSCPLEAFQRCCHTSCV